MPNERKPLVIDKETTFPVRYGTKTGVLILNPTYGVSDCILLSDCTGHVGSMMIEPDPAAEAVKAETERIRAEVGRCIWNEFSGPMSDNPRANSLIRDIDVAIDAPPEPVRTLTKQLGATEKERAFQVGQRNAADQLLRMKIEELAAAEAERNSAVIALAKRSEQLAEMRDQVRGKADLRKALVAAEGEIEKVTTERDRLLRMMNQHGSYNVLAESCTLVVRNCGLWHISRDGGPKATAVEYTELKDAIEAALEDKT